MSTPSPSPQDSDPASASHALSPALADRILAAIASLQYGSVEVVVHAGRIVQIDRRERTRVDRCSP